MIRILLADDHQLFRKGIISLLDDVEDIKVVAEAENGRDLLVQYYQVMPDLVICDISMPEGTGPEIIQKIKNRGGKPNVLFLSMYDSEEYIYYTFRVGALGLLGKNVVKEELVHAIREVAKGNKYFCGIGQEKLDSIIRKYSSFKNLDGKFEITALTIKELEVLRYVGEGLTSEEISQRMSLSRRTVDTHRTNIMNKLNIQSLPEFIKLAVEFRMEQNK